MTRKRVVFIGSSAWGLRALQTLTGIDEADVVGAITNPPVFNISYRPGGVTNVLHADVSSFCDEHDIPTYMMGRDESMKSQSVFDTIRSWDPDCFFVLGWYHLIPKAIRDVAPVLGMHYSLLPDYAGGAPLVWALINQEQRAGVTFFELDGGVDTGPIIGQAAVEIKERETIAELYERVGHESLSLLERDLPRYLLGALKPTIQTGHGRRVFPQRSPEDGLIEWALDATVVDAFIRAQTRPYPGAFTEIGGERVHIWSGIPRADAVGPPGTLAFSSDQVEIFCSAGAIVLEDVTVAGVSYTGLALHRVLHQLHHSGLTEDVVRPVSSVDA